MPNILSLEIMRNFHGKQKRIENIISIPIIPGKIKNLESLFVTEKMELEIYLDKNKDSLSNSDYLNGLLLLVNYFLQNNSYNEADNLLSEIVDLYARGNWNPPEK